MAELILCRYRWWIGDPLRNAKILDEFVAHPEWCTMPLNDDELRLVATATLVNLGSLVWECWREGELVGILLLTRVVPKIDALFHFLFFDSNLVGKRLLLKRFLKEYCFEELGFRRVSIEVPEHQHRYRDFCRRVLGFRYEGEGRPLDPSKSPDMGTQRWVAEQGSRRERAYCYKGKWLDLQLMRLLPEDVANADQSGDDSSGGGPRVEPDRGPGRGEAED